MECVQLWSSCGCHWERISVGLSCLDLVWLKTVECVQLWNACRWHWQSQGLHACDVSHCLNVSAECMHMPCTMFVCLKCLTLFECTCRCIFQHIACMLAMSHTVYCKSGMHAHPDTWHARLRCFTWFECHCGVHAHANTMSACRQCLIPLTDMMQCLIPLTNLMQCL